MQDTCSFHKDNTKSWWVTDIEQGCCGCPAEEIRYHKGIFTLKQASFHLMHMYVCTYKVYWSVYIVNMYSEITDRALLYCVVADLRDSNIFMHTEATL